MCGLTASASILADGIRLIANPILSRSQLQGRPRKSLRVPLPAATAGGCLPVEIKEVCICDPYAQGEPARKLLLLSVVCGERQLRAGSVGAAPEANVIPGTKTWLSTTIVAPREESELLALLRGGLAGLGQHVGDRHRLAALRVCSRRRLP